MQSSGPGQGVIKRGVVEPGQAGEISDGLKLPAIGIERLARADFGNLRLCVCIKHRAIRVPIQIGVAKIATRRRQLSGDKRNAVVARDLISAGTVCAVPATAWSPAPMAQRQLRKTGRPDAFRAVTSTRAVVA